MSFVVRPRGWRPAVVALALLAAPAACRGAPSADAPVPEEEPQEPLEPVTLQVRNLHRNDVVIYLVRGTVRSRVGQVVTGATGNWTFPEVAVRDAGGVFLIADPIGGRTSLRSDRLVLQPGRRVVWTLESGLGRSSMAIY